MKKLVSLISALTMCAVMTAPMVSSATTDVTLNTESKTSTFNFTTTIDSSYTVTIPDGSADLSQPVDLMVSATGVCIKGNQTLKVDVSSANKWNLHDENSGDLAYSLTAIKETTSEDNGITLTEGDVLVSKETAKTVGESFTVLTVDAGTPADKAIMRAKVEETAKMAGTYTDTLTFTVSVDGGEEQNQGTD